MRLPGLGDDAIFERYRRPTQIPRDVAEVLAIPVALVPALVNLSPAWSDLFTVLAVAFWGLLTADLAVRTYLVPRRGRYLLRHLPEVAIVFLWMLPIFTVPHGAHLLRAVLWLRLAPLVASIVATVAGRVRSARLGAAAGSGAH